MSGLHDRGPDGDGSVSFAEVVRVSEQEERHRISHLLRDDLQQILYGVQLKLALVDSMASLDEDDDERRARLRAALELIAVAIRTARRLTVNLSPPVLREEGLRDGLERLRTQMHDLHEVHVGLVGMASLHAPLPAALATLLVQVVRDVLLNLAYSGSTRVRLEAWTTDRALTLSISDETPRSDGEVVEAATTEELWTGLLAVRSRLQAHGADATLVSRPGSPPRLLITAPRLAVAGGRRTHGAG